ncbi:gfo/Idh/MocA family oxidoreductase [candidate division KSB1 bacterium]|nr:gfo/Idh/MocA family oxidoreductase [candidate division KSB1 bacterium]
MINEKKLNRRCFLKKLSTGVATGLAAPAFVPASVLGKTGTVAPGNRIVMAAIGVGWMGTEDLTWFLGEHDAQVVAVCDIDRNHLLNAKEIVDKKYGNNHCATYHDFRNVLARTDIDAVILGLPDHWHSIPAILAAKSGKDIYAEKPLSHTLREGRAMCDAVERYQRIWQTGSWQRSEANFRFACELVLNGRIGKVHTVQVGLPSGHTDFAGTKGQDELKTPPPELDYDFWLGPAPYFPYAVSRIHKNWRWVLEYGGGQLMDWVGHHVDIAHWGLGFDDSGPCEIDGYGDFPESGHYNAPTRYRLTAKYPRDITMIIAGGHDDIKGGTKWIGDKGWVHVDRGVLDAFPETLLSEKFDPGEIHLLESPGHTRNFLDCVKSRQQPLAPCHVAHRSATPGHLGMVAMTLGRKLRWDHKTETVIDDPRANALLGKAMRSPWHL